MDNYSAPGAIKITTISIQNFDGSKIINVTPLVVEFNIFESIQKPFVTASFVLNDALSLITRFPIIGQELINIEFKTPDSSFLKTVNQTLRIISIQELKRENIRQATYVLNCVSPAMISDMNTKIRKAYKDMTIDKMASDILTNFLDGDFITLDPTEGNRTFVIPNLSPSNAIKFLARQAKSLNYKSSPYFFYENCDGFHFRTSNDMINPVKRGPGLRGSSTDKYYAMDFDFTKTSRSPKDLVSKTGYSGASRNLSTKPYEYLKMKSFVFHNLGNYYTGLMTGYLENTVAFFDPITSQYEEKRFDYLKDNIKYEKTTISNSADFLTSSNDYIKDGSSYILFEPTNVRQVNSYPNDQNYDILNDKIGAKNIFDNVNVTVAIPGDSEKRAGDVVNFAFPEFGATDDIELELNKLVSGEYLILSVRHIYNASGYETVINASKNSYEYRIEDLKSFSSSLSDERNR